MLKVAATCIFRREVKRRRKKAVEVGGKGAGGRAHESVSAWQREKKGTILLVNREQLLYIFHENTGCLTNLFNLSSRSVSLRDPISKLPKAEDT